MSDSHEIVAKRIIIASGSRASAPPIPGLADVPYLTNENFWELTSQPKKLIIIGAGPIGFELGQSLQRMGSEVHIIDIAPPLARSEPEHAKVLVEALEAEGVTFHAPAKTKKISKTKTGIKVEFEDAKPLTGTHILVAAGRKPITEDLNLDAAGVEVDKRGYVVTDDCLRSTNKRVYAVGDVSGKGGLTHAAGYHASVIIKAFYFLPPIIRRWKGKATTGAMPAAIYSAPGLASIGLTEAQAREKHGDNIKTVSWDYHENDRAIAERNTKGGVKLVATSKGKLLGASIVGDGAGELIHVISTAMSNGVKIAGLAQIISPYPTRGEAIKRAAGSWYTDWLFGPSGKRIAKIMNLFN